MEQQAERILFCTDFSDNASKAFDEAVKIARMRPGCELLLLHVLPEPDAQFWKSYIYQVDGNVDDSAKKALDEAIDSDYRPRVPEGMSFSTAFRIGKAPTRILEYASEVGATMIVIGRQGCGSLQSLFFGSVALKVVQRAQCPVLVIPLC